MIDIDINNQIMLGIAAFVIILLLGNVLYIILKDRKKDKEEIDELINEMAEQEAKPQEVKKVEPPSSQVEMVETKIEEPKSQVEPVEIAVEESKVAFDEKKSEIEEMLEKMQQDLETKSEDVVETFEKEQEEKSIISYQELLKTIHKEDSINKIEVKEPVMEEVETIEEEIPAPATQHILNEETISPATRRILNEENIEATLEYQPKETQAIVEEKKETQAVKKFKNTDFISPIYGKMEEHFEYPKVPSFHPKEEVVEPYEVKQEETVEDVIETFDRKLEEHPINDYLEDYGFHTHMKIDSLEQTLNMPPISPEIKENEEFLQALKEFRKNLE